MSKKTFYVLMAVSMISIPGFSAQERVLRVQNHVRVGYDDNLYYSGNKEGSAYITDILNLTGNFHVSSRTDLLLYWQPEYRYRFDADPKDITYQDLYADLNHALSQRLFLVLSDRFRYQMKDGQSGAGIKTTDQNYVENDLKGALDIDAGELSQIKLGAGYELRRWDDSAYGNVNDFDRYQANAAYLHELKKNKTTGTVSVNYTDHEYEGSRGGYDAVSLIAGVDQNFNPNLTGFGRVGASMASVDNASGSNDSTTPYLDAGLEFNPTARTRLNGSMGYTISYSENSFYNAQNEFNIRFGARHDLTSKISLSSSIAYIFSMYDADYTYGGVVRDSEDSFIRVSFRAAYQINRSNFLEAGYEYSERWTDAASFLTEYNRNTFDIGWRLRL